MDQAEILGIVGMQRELILNTWNFYISVNLAVLGIIFITHRHINIVERLLGVGAYMAFAYVNYGAQRDNYTYLEFLFEEVAATGLDIGYIFAIGPISEYLPYIYGTAAVVMVLLFTFINLLSHDRREEQD